MLPLFGWSGPVSWRSDFLVEHAPVEKLPGSLVPAYCAVHTDTGVYVYYATGEEEYYDLLLQPYEELNLVGQPEQQAAVAAMRTRLPELCQPPPPGLTLPG